MSTLTVFFSVLFFTLLGVAYVKGYDFVKSHSPNRLVHFYLIMVTIRILLVAMVVLLYVILSQNYEESVRFAAVFLGMYVVMMVITLILKH